MFIDYHYYFINDDLFNVMKNYHYNNIPILQLNIKETPDGKFFQAFEFNYPYDCFECDSINELLEYVETIFLDEI